MKDCEIIFIWNDGRSSGFQCEAYIADAIFKITDLISCDVGGTDIS